MLMHLSLNLYQGAKRLRKLLENNVSSFVGQIPQTDSLERLVRCNDLPDSCLNSWKSFRKLELQGFRGRETKRLFSLKTAVET